MGLDYMARAGFDPAGAIALWQNMQAVEKSSPPEFLSTHPAHDTRIHNLQQRMPTAVAEYQEAKARGATPHCNTSTRPVAAR